MMRFLKWSVIGVFLLATSLWAADVNIHVSNAGDDFVEIYVDNTTNIGGFQFNLTDTPNAFDIDGASGGSAQDAGFMISTNTGGLVLGFSLTGSFIPPGGGVLTTVAINNLVADYSQLTLTGLIFSDQLGNALTVDFNQGNGMFEWGDVPVMDMANFTISPGLAEAGTTSTVEVSFENTMEAGGFQFVLVDTPDLISLVSATTTARTNGFMLSTNDNGLVLGFSLTGATIAAGDGPIAVLTFQAGNDGGVADIAFTEIVLSDPLGNPILATSEDGTFEVTGGILPEPTVTILSPTDGSTVVGSDINVEVSAENLVDGDHYHAYLDGNSMGMFYSETFTLSGVAFGAHDLSVVIADINHVEYENAGATDMVSFTNQDVPPVDITTLYMAIDSVDAFDEVTVPLSMTNLSTIAGFQLQLVDFPNYLEITGVDVTDRTSEFMVTFNEQGDGTVIVVGFDLSAVGVVPGAGPILDITYHSTNQYENDITTSINLSSSILSDIAGQQVEFEAESGNIHVIGEVPPELFAPENLIAVAGFQMANLSWTHPQDWTVVGYYIMRDGVNVGEASMTNFADTGLETQVEYCYTVLAYNDFVQSGPSNEVCITTIDINPEWEAPVNLIAEENGLEITLTWETPPSQIGIGDDCEGCDSGDCMFDCIMQCVDASTVYAWLGDGLCDDGSWGIYLNCEYFDWDYGDCPPEDPGNQNPGDKEFYVVDAPSYRLELEGYEVYRNNQLLIYTEDLTYVDTDGLWYLETYCYNVTAVYDDGISSFSNTSCAIPQLGQPSMLSGMGTGDFITLEWNAHPDNAQDGFNIYRDGELHDSAVGTTYEDHGTVHDVEYCYTVTAFYDGIGESPATNEVCTMWSLYPPSQITAMEGDGYVDLTWEEPQGGEEVVLSYDSGLLANAFYFYDTYESGYAHGTKFNVGTEFDVLSASIYILSEGDQYWPWPNSSHGPVRVMIFDDIDGMPGNLLYDEEATSDETGFATVYPNVTGLSGAFYVITSHTENWSTGGDAEGYGVDDGVNFPDNMATYQAGVWTVGGDVLGYGGDYMMSSLILAYGTVIPLSSNDGEAPNYPAPDMTTVNSVHNGELSLIDQTLAIPPSSYVNTNSRTLESFNIYRDGDPTPIANVPADTYSYRDEPLANMIEYCYTLVGVYTEGLSDPSDPVCATPVPGYQPQNLTASDMGNGSFDLVWEEPVPFLNPVLDYQIYRDGEWVGSSATLSYTDEGLPAGVIFCYTVTAQYASGESFPSNEDCSVYVLNPPVGVEAQGMNDEHAILVTWYDPLDAYSLDLEIFTDNYAGEVSWSLTDASGTVVGSITSGTLTDPDMLYTWNFVITPGTYTFTINDTFGDGICCAYGDGYYNLLLNGTLLATGGDYGTGESVTFDTDNFLVDVFQTHYEEAVPFEKGTNITEADLAGLTISEPELVSSRTITRIDRTEGYNIYRDGGVDPVGTVGGEVFEYMDYETTNDVVYCYIVRAIYADGESIPSNEACAQWILPPPSGLVAVGTEGNIELTWDAAVSNDVLYYEITRDGSFLSTTTETIYSDNESEHDILYCYVVYAVYDLGTSAGTQERCAMWMILPPSGLSATAGAEMVHLEWEEGVNAPCADDIIPVLPFNDTGSIVGLTDDWLVQGSQGADFAYGLVLNSATLITVDLCSELTDYDAKLEIFTADDECIASTTGFYDDDGPSCPESPSVYGPSLIENAYLEAGAYYIVVDGFSGAEGNYEINVWESAGLASLPSDPAEAMAYESEKSGIQYSIDNWNIAEFGSGSSNLQRPLVGYNIYRYGVMIGSVDAGIFEYDDLGLDNLTEYCYTVRADYDEGESPDSNEACATPIPGNPPTGLTARGENDYILLDWDEPMDTAGDVNFYTIYRDGSFLTTTTDITHQDATTDHDVEYCYTVTADYPTGESFPTNESCSMWQLCPPSYLDAEAGDGYVDVTWEATSCGTEVALNYDDGVLANAFYFYDTYETGYAHGTRFDVGTEFDVLAASLKILSEGDEYWPWPDASHGPVRVMIFDDNNGTPGTLLYDEEATSDETGFATVYPNITGLTGSFYVIASHTESWSGAGDPEGYGVDGGVDYPNNMVTMQTGTWSTGDVLGYGGDYMTSTLINAYGQIQPMSYSDLPFTPFENMDMVASIENLDGSLSPESHPSYFPQINRTLDNYSLYRDGELHATLLPDVWSFHDDVNINNMQEYCYHMTANYTEGSSDPTETVCATPIPGMAPTNLDATSAEDHIDLMWTGGTADVMYYNIYRDGDPLDTSTGTTYADNDATNDVTYCYVVTAMYASGESFPTDEDCAGWTLGTVELEILTEGNGFIEIGWSDLIQGVVGGGGVVVTIVTDSWAQETSWDIVDSGGNWVDGITAGGLVDFTTYVWELELEAGTYVFNINDSFGDGIYCSDNGYYQLDVDGQTLAGGPGIGCDFGSGASHTFTVGGGLLSSSEFNYSPPVTGEKGQTEYDLTGIEIIETVTYVNPNQDINVNRSLVGFIIFRDGDQLDEVDVDVRTYGDNPLENGVEHCYYVLPMFDPEGPASASNTVCGMADAGPLCPPENFDVEIVDGLPYAHLTWGLPADCGSALAVVTIVTDTYPYETSWDIVDSNGSQVDGISPGDLTDNNTTYTWENELPADTYILNIYDSYGDGIYCSQNSYYQLDLNGETIAGGPGIGCDFGAGASHTFTVGGGLLSSSQFEYSPPISGEKGQAEYDMTGIELIETITYVYEIPENDSQLNRPMIAYRIYRNGGMVAEVGSDTDVYEFFDTEETGLVFNVEHGWTMKTIYDEGDSNPTEEIRGMVVDPGSISHMYFEEGSLVAGTSGDFDVSLTNTVDVAGFQFTLVDLPDILTVEDVMTTDRTDGWMLSFNAQPNGSVIIVGFDLTGTSPIVGGEGSILTATYSATPVILNQTDVTISFEDVYMGDQAGNQILTYGHDSMIIVSPQGASELLVGDATCDVDGECDFDISLTNLESVISGFQFVLSFDPDIAHLVTVTETDRTAGWMISGGAETGTIIGFSIDGSIIEMGEGPIMTVTVFGEAEGEAASCLSQIILSNPDGDQVPVTSECGMLTVLPPADAPVLTSATASEGQIDIDWTFDPSTIEVNDEATITRETIELSIQSFDNGQLAIHMVNTEDVGGFQFVIDSDVGGYSLTSASGGTAGANGFMMSTNNSGLVLGFSLTGAVIPAGGGVLVYADVAITGDAGCFSISSPVISDAGGIALDIAIGDPFCLGDTEVYGCTDPEALNFNPEATIDDGSCIYDILGCTDPEALNFDPDATLDDGSCMYPTELTFNIYRDGMMHDSVVEIYTFSDMGLGAGATYCYTVTAVLEDGSETDHSNELCATTPDVGCMLDFYADLPDNTGEASLIIVSGVTGIEVGECDEIGVFDDNAILNSGDCETVLGELLVGAGVWANEQLSISAVGSLDYCDIGGNQFPGYVENNPVLFKYFHAASGVEYLADATFLVGDGGFGAMITTVTLEIVTDETQIITLNPFMNNMFSTYISLNDPSVSLMFSDQVLIVQNDTGDFYVPLYGIDQIGDLDYLECYTAFINGSNTLEFEFTGSRVDQDTPFMVNPFMNDMIPYFGENTMPASVAFGPHNDDILIVYNDSGEFYVPSYGIDLINDLVPGEGYVMFLSGSTPMEFSYPADGLASPVANEWEALKSGLVSQQYDVVKTGVVQPIIITGIQGNVAVGDEIAVYANGTLVGATRVVDTDRPLPVTAWGAIDQFGVDLPGYQVGDAIEIRYWSQSQNTELRVTTDLNGQYFGLSPLTTGRLVVHSDSAVPTQFSLDQNYPNPFNPNTTIEFSLPHDTKITISVYDIMGREIRTLVSLAETSAGYHSVVWDGMDKNGVNVSAGLYIYSMQGEGVSITRKMIMMK
ncbi:MAG: T9SS type A sorting domain-containing protein [Candidatus Marinimicrobia bacterium]|nr:T9SS type A sorting domain-containing protein [Candidatus Neomarinimicrobiota bacterium]